MTISWFSNETWYFPKWPPGIDIVKPLSIRTGVLIGQGMPFFYEGSDLQAKCCTTVAITESSFKSHTLITCSHIRCHRNAEEIAETTGYTLMQTNGDVPHAHEEKPRTGRVNTDFPLEVETGEVDETGTWICCECCSKWLHTNALTFLFITIRLM